MVEHWRVESLQNSRRVIDETIPPKDTAPATGRQYWRSLDHWPGQPEFKQWLEREFPRVRAS